MSTITSSSLLELIESDLGQGRKSGRNTLFHCPFPGHLRGDKHPSLTVAEAANDIPAFWKCWSCGKHGGRVKWLTEYRGLSVHDALAYLQLKPDPNYRKQDPPIQRPDNPPSHEWQTRGLQLIERAESALWDGRGKDLLAWLRSRGLQDETIRAAHLGYIPKDFSDSAENWGTPNDETRKIYFFKGLLIPGVIASKVWYLKMRPSHPRGGMSKYMNIRGSKSCALYGADHISDKRPAVFCEGELDALLLKQEINELASVITFGAASNNLNLATWGIYLLRPSSFVIAYDVDSAGNGAAANLAWLHDAQRLRVPLLSPGDKDLTDFYKSGGNLRSLIESVLQDQTPILITWPADRQPATIQGQYLRKTDARIEAFYLPDELEICLRAMKALSEPQYEQA